MKELTINDLIKEAKTFSSEESKHWNSELYGVTDGKAIGTYIEHKFLDKLEKKYIFIRGNSAVGIDIPSLNIDIKVTSIKQPQSSCPFKSAEQKIYGLGYNLLIFIYDKIDDISKQQAKLNILHTIFIKKEKTADYQTTKGIQEILKRNGNKDDIISFLYERHLPIDEVGANLLAEKIINNPPEIGYLTISNALQWRLQYRRVIDFANQIEGIVKVF